MSSELIATNNDYLDAGNPSALNIIGDQLTVFVRIKLTSINGEQKFLAKWSDSPESFQFLLSVNDSRNCLFAINNGGQVVVTGTTTLVVGVWYDIVGVKDETEIRIYLNGVEEGSTLTIGDIISTSTSVRLGAGSGGAGTENPMDGLISHVFITDTAYSAEKIQSLYYGANVLQFSEGVPISYWPLNANLELDVIGGHNMTVYGATAAPEPPIPNSIKAP